MQLEIPLETQKTADAVAAEQEGTVTKATAAPDATEQALRDRQQPPAKEAPKPESKPEAKAEEPKPAADDALQIKVPEKVDFAAVAKEYQESEGQLSKQTLKLLESKGITEDLVQTFIEGQKARAQITRSELAKAVGGDESLTAVLQWAATGLDATEVATYNTLLKSSDLTAQKVALQALKARMDADLGTEGTRVVAEGVPSTRGVQPFLSMAEVTTAMRSKEYKTDPAFRAKVAQRLAISNV